MILVSWGTEVQVPGERETEREREREREFFIWAGVKDF
jgi:hypothetical protein